MDELFASFGATLEQEAAKRESIKDLCHGLDNTCRALQATMQTIHASRDRLPIIGAKIDAALPSVTKTFKSVSEILQTGEYYKYKQLWQSYVRLCLNHWLNTQELLTLEMVAARLSLAAPMNVESADVLCLELEDYLYGVALIPSELSRLCVNAVTAGDYELPVKISQFISSLYSAFQLLHLKNDFLRKKYDSIKYDVNRVEQVLYDMKVRGLGGEKSDATASKMAVEE